MYYGVKIDTTVADPALTRVGKNELHQSLPVQSLMRRCLVNDQGKVVTYLNANDSTMTDTGAAADLTGAVGQVMVEIPEHYRKFEFDGTAIYALISLYPLPGFSKVRRIFRSAYEATVQRSTNKLASVVNKTADYRGGGNNSAWDGTYRDLCGRPATNISLTSFRTYARNRGAVGLNGVGWNCDLYEAAVNTYWLFVIEYAQLNCQAAFTAELTAEGYHKGGLGNGVTNFPNWGTYNSNNPFVPCGQTNSLGNKTGVVDYIAPAEDGSTFASVSVPSYRGIENPFGHLWSWTDGVLCNIQSEADGGLSKFYRANDDNPANFSSTAVDTYTQRGVLPRTESYVKQLMVGALGDIMPLAVGASSITYFCDYFYTNIPSSGTALRGVLFGGPAYYGASAGLALAITNNAPSNTNTYIGSRLCFIPET